MRMRKSAGTGDIPVADGTKHFLVLIRQQDLPFALLKIREMQVKHPTALIQQPFKEGCQIGTSAQVCDGHVKGFVCLRHRKMSARVHGCHKLPLAARHGFQVKVCAQFGGQLGIHPLRYVQRLDMFWKTLHIDRRHDGRAVRQSDDQIVSSQTNKRLTHRRA